MFIPGVIFRAKRGDGGGAWRCASTHWHDWHTESQYDTCHIFWPKEHQGWNISAIYFAKIFAEIFPSTEGAKYFIKYFVNPFAV